MKLQTANPRAPLKHKKDLAEDLVQLLNQCWRKCRRKMERLQNGRFNAEAVHQARIAARQLLSVLDTVLPWADEKPILKARKGIKRQFSLFSPVRDTDVQCGYLHELSARFPQIEPFYRALLKRKKTLTANARKELAVPGKLSRKLQRCLVARLQEHLFLPHELFSQIKAAYDQVLTLRQSVRAEAPETLHRLRVAFKKFRYSAFAVQDILPVLEESASERMRTVQGRLGEIQDLSVLTIRLNKLADKKLRRYAGDLEPVLKSLKTEETAKIAVVISELDNLLNFQLPHPTG